MIMPESEKSAVTYVVPTHNRSEFLHRLLEFFSQAELKNPIVVADSSNDEVKARNRQLVIRYADQLRIDYFPTSLPLIEKISAALYRVTTPFTALCADDDFAFPNVVDQCVEILARHPEIAVAQGRVVNASNTSSIRASAYECEMLNSYSITQDGAEARLSTMASQPFSTFYATHRTELIRRQFDLTAEFTDYQAGRVFTESLLIGLSVIGGKVEVIPEVHYIQQVHGGNDSCRLSRISDRSQKDELYARYKTALVRELQRETDLTHAASDAVVESCIALLPGFTKRKRKSGLRIGSRISRELNRMAVRIARAFSRRNVGVVTSSEQSAEIRNAHVIPDGPEYQIAFQLLTRFPEGISAELSDGKIAA